MKRYLLALFLFLVPSFAFAQSQRNPCYYATPTGSGCTPVSATTPLPVISGGGTSIIGKVGIDQTTPGVTNGVVTNSPVNFSTAQVSITTASTVAVAARAGRQKVIITNITGTQPIYCSGTTATTANGQLIPAVVGANFTVATTAAINCIASTTAQTISVAETY